MMYDVMTKYLPTGEVFTVFGDVKDLTVANALARRLSREHEESAKQLGVAPNNVYYVHFKR